MQTRIKNKMRSTGQNKMDKDSLRRTSELAKGNDKNSKKKRARDKE